jgi:heme oxygenase (biliverdin-IX-beta and delta-forming)
MATDVRSLILEKLKQSTCIHHHHASNSSDILSLQFSVEDYGSLLQRLWGFYTPLETFIAQRGEWPLSTLDYEHRKKVPLLERDLQTLGIFAPGSLPICTELPELVAFSQMLGCMYVLEGATLGGQIISRHMQKTMGIDQTTGCAYFCSYGDEVSSMWQTFCHILTTYASTHALENQIIQAASSTFSTLNAWLDESKYRNCSSMVLPPIKTRGVCQKGNTHEKYAVPGNN